MTLESGNAGMQAGSAGPDMSPPDAFPEQSYGGQDMGMAETDVVATSVQSADSSHGGSTQVASSQVDASLIVPGQATAIAVPLRRSQRSRRLNPKYFDEKFVNFATSHPLAQTVDPRTLLGSYGSGGTLLVYDQLALHTDPTDRVVPDHRITLV
nr:uncharacterized protein LOC109178464 [Ipomoea trifida]GME07700.1 uncharacterized protein LOC109178464 [Ipomoea batatas]